jgi:hypothetical protein
MTTRPRYLRRVIHIAAEDSPNVALGLMQQAQGVEPTGEEVLPGPLSWYDYQKRLRLWDEVMICIGLRGRFWEGSEALLYPPEWLNASGLQAIRHHFKARHPDPAKRLYRKAKAGFCDPGEGGDPNRLGTAWAIVDELGVLEVVEKRTVDTSEIIGFTRALLRKHHLAPEKFGFDRGGGGKQHADTMRSQGWNVRTVGFGEPVGGRDPKPGTPRVAERLDLKEEGYAYVSRRVQMYHGLRLAVDPGLHSVPWAIPQGRGGSAASPTDVYAKLRQEMALIPLLYDGKGRMRLPDKYRSGGKRQAGQERTLTEIVGHSPDLLDALAGAHYMLTGYDEHRPRAGGLRQRQTPADMDDYTVVNNR